MTAPRLPSNPPQPPGKSPPLSRALTAPHVLAELRRLRAQTTLDLSEATQSFPTGSRSHLGEAGSRAQSFATGEPTPEGGRPPSGFFSNPRSRRRESADSTARPRAQDRGKTRPRVIAPGRFPGIQPYPPPARLNHGAVNGALTTSLKIVTWLFDALRRADAEFAAPLGRAGTARKVRFAALEVAL